MASGSARRGFLGNRIYGTVCVVAGLKGDNNKCREKHDDIVVNKVKHPTVAKMVTTAIGALNNKRGSSLLAVKHYLATTYHVNPAKLKTHIRRFLKQALVDGTLVQTKGRGAAGLFRLGRRVGLVISKRHGATQKGKDQGKAMLRARSRRRELERSITDQEMLKSMKKLKKPVAAAMRATICDPEVPFQCIKRKFSNIL